MTAESKASWQTPLAQLLCMLALAIAPPAILCRLLNVPDNLAGQDGVVKDFDPATESRMLRKIQPDWVLVGNSMLNTRVDNAPLAAISGLKVRKVSKGGSQSALWFLYLKNVIVSSGVRPAVVTIFFRDTDLTWPDFRVKGVNEETINELQGPAQPEWQAVFASETGGVTGLPDWIRQGLNDLFPSSDLRTVARRSMQERAFRLTRIGTRMNSSGRRVELNLRFSLGHLRHDLGSDFSATNGQQSLGAGANSEIIDPGFYEDGPKVFDPTPQASFLPHLVKLADDNGIRLHFHRIKRRPASNHQRPDDIATAAYMNDLRQWLESRHCLFTDESKDSSLTLDMYADGDHISEAPAIQQAYLKNFWARVSPLITPLARSSPPKDSRP